MPSESRPTEPKYTPLPSQGDDKLKERHSSSSSSDVSLADSEHEGLLGPSEIDSTVMGIELVSRDDVDANNKDMDRIRRAAPV